MWKGYILNIADVWSIQLLCNVCMKVSRWQNWSDFVQLPWIFFSIFNTDSQNLEQIPTYWGSFHLCVFVKEDLKEAIFFFLFLYYTLIQYNARWKKSLNKACITHTPVWDPYKGATCIRHHYEGQQCINS